MDYFLVAIEIAQVGRPMMGTISAYRLVKAPDYETATECIREALDKTLEIRQFANLTILPDTFNGR